MARLSRRAVLAAAPMLAAAACSTSRRPAAARRVGPTPRAAGTSTAPRPADWRALQRSVSGRLVRPGDPSYPAAHALYDPRFDHVRPAAVLQAASADDVSHGVTFARRHGLPLHLRAGGHSYLGASTGPGLVIDVRPLDTIAVSATAGTATFGSGVRLIDAYGTLATHSVSIPAGSCPTVGLTGLTLGGGIGVVSRLYGLTCDRLVSADLVTATGDQITVSAGRHPDLFFALRGGGGSFGAVTSMTLRTHPAGSLAVFTLRWDWSAAARVLGAWMPWCTDVPDALWSTCHLLSVPGSGPPTASVSGVYAGSAAGVGAYLDRLVSAVGVDPVAQYAADRGYLDTMLLEAGCDHETVEQCHLVGTTPGATVGHTTFVAASDLYDRPIPPQGVAAVVQAVEARQADPRLGVGGVAFDALGGAIASIPADATAYAHRAARFGAQWSASWPVTDPGAQARNERSLRRLQASAHRWAVGAYANYPTAGRRDAPAVYWGPNLPRLEAIKRRWDPTGVFEQPQGVPG